MLLGPFTDLAVSAQINATTNIIESPQDGVERRRNNALR
jgi:hypothetical protein